MLERRFSNVYGEPGGKLEKREENGKRKLSGYAIVFNSRSVDLGGFIEIIKPGAANRTQDPDARIAALNGHVSHLVIGNTAAGTLRTSVNSKGLYHECDPPDNGPGRDLMVSVDRGDIDSMSFGFRTLSDEWKMKDGMLVREVTDMIVSEISYTAFPAYPTTSAQVRSIVSLGIGEGERFITALLKHEHRVGLDEEDRRILQDAVAKIERALKGHVAPPETPPNDNVKPSQVRSPEWYRRELLLAEAILPV